MNDAQNYLWFFYKQKQSPVSTTPSQWLRFSTPVLSQRLLGLLRDPTQPIPPLGTERYAHKNDAMEKLVDAYFLSLDFNNWIYLFSWVPCFVTAGVALFEMLVALYVKTTKQPHRQEVQIHWAQFWPASNLLIHYIISSLPGPWSIARRKTRKRAVWW